MWEEGEGRVMIVSLLQSLSYQFANLFLSGCNVCRLNSEHQLLAIGTEEVGKSILCQPF